MPPTERISVNMKKLNLPNKLTLLRVLLVPAFVVFLVIDFTHVPELYARLIAAAIFGICSFTDMLDGKIARKHNLITNFGKFMDPLADKFMVFAALLCICSSSYFASIRAFAVWAALIVFFRELAITSMRLLVVNASGVVIAANWMGKVKTVSQIIFILSALLEVDLLWDIPVLTYVSMAVMTFFTIASGINYMKAYWKAIDPEN